MENRGSKARAAQARQEWARAVYECRHMDNHTYKRGACIVCGAVSILTAAGVKREKP